MIVKTFLKKQVSSIESYLSSIEDLILSREETIEVMRVSGTVPENISDIQEALERAKELVTTLGDHVSESEFGVYSDQGQSGSDPATREQSTQAINAGEKALLSLYRESFPDWFSRDQVEDRAADIALKKYE